MTHDDIYALFVEFLLNLRTPCDLLFFFFNDTATTEIYTLSLHDALPISRPPPPHSNKPATNCSPTSCDAACWKPASSTRRNGSTTRCCIWPTVTKGWTSRSSPSCAS